MIITEVIPRVFVVFTHSTDAIPPITSSLVLDIVYSTGQTLSRVISTCLVISHTVVTMIIQNLFQSRRLQDHVTSQVGEFFIL